MLTMSTVWLLLITLLVVCLAVFNVPKYLWFLYRRNRAIRHVPGWPTHWLLGNLHQFRLDHSTLVKWAEFIQKNRHKVAKIWLGPFYPVIEICHSSGVHKVIKLPKDRSIYSYLMPWLGEGLLISKWTRNRRLLLRPFTMRFCEGMFL